MGKRKKGACDDEHIIQLKCTPVTTDLDKDEGVRPERIYKTEPSEIDIMNWLFKSSSDQPPDDGQ